MPCALGPLPLLWLLELCNTPCVTRVRQCLYTCQEQCIPLLLRRMPSIQ